MSDNNKTIRFITSDYKELFNIPDGGSIKIIYPPGDDRGTITRACKFLDEMHFQTLGRGGDVYHSCQFAEIMERIGAKYEPEVQLQNMKLTPFLPGEEKFLTYNREEGNTCIGHISGNFGNDGDRFHSNWSDRKNDRNTPEFQAELHSAVYALRYQYNFLKSYNTMRALCDACPEAKLPDKGDHERYGFKLEMDARQYFVSCFFGENMRDSSFIAYAYDKPAPVLEQAQPSVGDILPSTAADSKMFYRNDAEGSLNVGYSRGDYGKNGNEFHHSWFDSGNGKNTPEFKAEFQDVMNTLRHEVLKDLKTTRDYCDKHPEARLPGDNNRYGFKLETANRRYFVRCTVLQNDYFYVFAREKAAVREQERPAGDHPSVLKQIRDAQKAPKPPRKAKSPDKKKDGVEL